MIDKNKIFKLFVDGKEVVGDKTEEEIKDFMNGPYAKIGMFVKLIQNHEIFHKKLSKFLKQEQPDYNVESTKEASEYTVYYRAWSYIKNIDLSWAREDLSKLTQQHLNWGSGQRLLSSNGWALHWSGISRRQAI